MKIIVSLTSISQLNDVQAYHPDCIELRLDLMTASGGTVHDQLRSAGIPLVVTLRSVAEGGKFKGSDEEWRRLIDPWLEIAAYIDIERNYASNAARIRERRIGIIASAHLDYMPQRRELDSIEKELRAYGDIPKIVVTPGDSSDVLELLSFTRAAPKPLCTGVMGEKNRYARAILPFFGSAFTYCHAGTPTASGQLHIREMKQLMEILE
jgi:3-dehydroquinate dehydratase-1